MKIGCWMWEFLGRLKRVVPGNFMFPTGSFSIILQYNDIYIS